MNSPKANTKRTCGQASFELRTTFGCAVLLGVGLVSPSALAQESGVVCEDPRISVVGRPDERWREPIGRACTELEDTPDSDPTSRVRLVPAGRDLVVEVALEDGRTAVRRVRDPARLKSTLEALMTLPPPPPRHVEPAAPPPSAPGAASSANEAPAPAPPSVAPVPASPRLGFEVGVTVGGRFAGAQAYLSVAPRGYADLRINDWLIGVGARWDVFQTKDDVPLKGFEMDTVAADLSVGRRLHFGGGNVDLGVSSRLLVETQSFVNAANVEDTDAQTDMRLGPFARVAIGRGSLRPIIVLDGEVSPGRLRRNIRVGQELPVLPSWSIGLSAGVAWGEP